MNERKKEGKKSKERNEEGNEKKSQERKAHSQSAGAVEYTGCFSAEG